MEFELNEEQRLVQDQVRRFLEAEIRPLDDEFGDEQMTPELGKKLLKMVIPMGYAGRDRPADAIMQAILDEEIGRVSPSLGGIAFIANAAMMMVPGAAHPDVRRRLAEPLLDGDLIGCAAFSEPDVGSDPSSIACKAELKGDYYLVNGTKTWISNGHIADVAMVTVQTDRDKGPAGLRQLLIDRNETPFESRDIESIGLKAFPLSELYFRDLKVPAINRLGGWTEGAGLPDETSGGGGVFNFAGARVMCASIACGIAMHALEQAVEYVKTRRQFGREIGRFQMVQQMIADMTMDLEAARLLTYRARQKLSREPCDKEVSMAKAYATEMGVRVTSKAMECMGAMGLTTEARLERSFRDARMWLVPDGTSQIQRLIIGRAMTGFSATRG